MIKKSKDLTELIYKLEAEQNKIQLVLDALKKPRKTIEEKLFIEYLITQSTVKVAELAKQNEYKTASKRIFSPSDMSTLIENGCNNVPQCLIDLAREIFSNNKKAVTRAYG